MHFIARRGIIACLVGASTASSLVAQAATTAAAVDTARRNQTLFVERDAFIAAGFVGLTVAMYPADKYFAHHLRDQTQPANHFFDVTSRTFENISIPGAYIIGPTLYLVGRVLHHPGVEDLGWHGTEGVLLATGIAGIVKGLAGRARPYATVDSNARDFKFGKGFSNSSRQSFPSAHAAVSFAAAASVTSEVDRMWPRYTWFVGPILYGGATVTSIGRMYHNQHWASDVAVGAGIGTFAGLKVVRYSHQHPDNRIDKILLRLSVAPDGRGGGMVGVSLPVP
jgi:membrane-associated phospholipid phosphatase